MVTRVEQAAALPVHGSRYADGNIAVDPCQGISNFVQF